MNIDTDNDGNPDLNLVILKKTDWKPTVCVKRDTDKGILEEYCTGTSVKAVINVDTDNDGVPNINIDTNGDMKADINVDTDNEGVGNVNIAPINVWKPNKAYTHQKFQYDTMKIDALINIDSDGDGRPDINVDTDGDGNPDINIDVDGDGIPDTNIDGDGDGKADINIDTDGDGKPDENIKEITSWKPDKNVDGDLPYDTMIFDAHDKSDTITDQPKTSVKGQYNPVTSIGGADTGDETILFNYMYTAIITSIFISCLYYLRKRNAI